MLLAYALYLKRMVIKSWSFANVKAKYFPKIATPKRRKKDRANRGKKKCFKYLADGCFCREKAGWTRGCGWDWGWY